MIKDEESESFDFEKYKRMMFLQMIQKAGITEEQADMMMLDALKWRSCYLDTLSFRVLSTVKVMKGASVTSTIDPKK